MYLFGCDCRLLSVLMNIILLGLFNVSFGHFCVGKLLIRPRASRRSTHIPVSKQVKFSSGCLLHFLVSNAIWWHPHVIVNMLMRLINTGPG